MLFCDQAPFLFYLANSLHRCENKEAYMCFKEGAMLRVNKSKNKRVSESC